MFLDDVGEYSIGILGVFIIIDRIPIFQRYVLNEFVGSSTIN